MLRCNWDKYRIHKEKILKPYVGTHWYNIICLRSNLHTYRYLVHRLVAQHFITNTNNYPVVMHIDNNKLNCSVDNLKWWTQKDNLLQCKNEWRSFNIWALSKWKYWESSYSAKTVLQFSKDWTFIKRYWSIIDASINTNSNSINIWLCCKWRRKTAGGFIWRSEREIDSNSLTF